MSNLRRRTLLGLTALAGAALAAGWFAHAEPSDSLASRAEAYLHTEKRDQGEVAVRQVRPSEAAGSRASVLVDWEVRRVDGTVEEKQNLLVEGQDGEIQPYCAAGPVD